MDPLKVIYRIQTIILWSIIVSAAVSWAIILGILVAVIMGWR